MSTTIIKSGNSDNQAIVDDTGHLLVSGSTSGGNESVGATGITAPTSATETAGIDPNGNLKALSVDLNGFLNVNGTSTVVGTVSTSEEGLDSFKTSQYVIGTSEVQITPTPLANRSSISLKVVATAQNVIYFCQTSGQALTEGYPLSNGDSVQMDLTPSGTIYAVSTAPGQNLYVLEIA